MPSAPDSVLYTDSTHLLKSICGDTVPDTKRENSRDFPTQTVKISLSGIAQISLQTRSKKCGIIVHRLVRYLGKAE